MVEQPVILEVMCRILNRKQLEIEEQELDGRRIIVRSLDEQRVFILHFAVIWAALERITNNT